MSDDSIFMVNVEQYLLRSKMKKILHNIYSFICLRHTSHRIHTKSKSYSITNGYGSGDSFRKTNYKTLMYNGE